MNLQIPDPDFYGISNKFGFLSPQAPPSSFTTLYYEPWDVLVSRLPALIKSGDLVREIETLPLLEIDGLIGDLEYQRAYVVLAFLVHGYVWSGTPPREAIPAQLAEPFLAVCKKVGLQPVVSYAGLCLWNWRLKDGNSGFELENMRMVASFTGTRGEAAFYHVPVLIEYYGGHLMHTLLEAIKASEANNRDAVIEALKDTTNSIVTMGTQLSKLYPILDADFFFLELRPFIAGGKGMEQKGLPRGMIFRKQNGEEEPYKLAGGSAGQSSIFPFLDHMLGVTHEDQMFPEMRGYMPGAHREFLNQVFQLPTLRSYVANSDDGLQKAYDDCMKELRAWRGKHIAVVSKYIIQPARREAEEAVMVRDTKGGESASSANEGDLQGSGGSALIPFLRNARDDTVGL